MCFGVVMALLIKISSSVRDEHDKLFRVGNAAAVQTR